MLTITSGIHWDTITYSPRYCSLLGRSSIYRNMQKTTLRIRRYKNKRALCLSEVRPRNNTTRFHRNLLAPCYVLKEDIPLKGCLLLFVNNTISMAELLEDRFVFYDRKNRRKLTTGRGSPTKLTGFASCKW